LKMTRSYANVVSSKYLHRLQGSSESSGKSDSSGVVESEHATCSSDSVWDSFVIPSAMKNSTSAASSPSSGYCTPNSSLSQGQSALLAFHFVHSLSINSFCK
uniref:Vestigial like 2a n=1 Tax=Anisakis simplex TaxID=6269 RepID=A0A0M3JML7_ANISI